MRLRDEIRSGKRVKEAPDVKPAAAATVVPSVASSTDVSSSHPPFNSCPRTFSVPG